MRLLLVEDEIDIQSFLRTSLEEAGYEVEAAADGKTAELLAVDGSFDILIVDLGLPDIDGISLILKLRQLGVRAPVLILSARRSVDDRVRGLEQGGDDYLTKPFWPGCAICSGATVRRRARRPGCAFSILSWTCYAARLLDPGRFCSLRRRNLCCSNTSAATPAVS